MRSFLWAVPASLVLLTTIGCSTGQHVKYDVDGKAVAVEEHTYEKPANTNPAPATVLPEPAPAPEPAPVAVQPKPVVEPAPAPKPVAPKPAPAPKPAEHAGANTYVVQKGDTLQKISQKTYGTTKKWPAIMKANGMKDDKIRVGQKLVLPQEK